MIWSIELLGRLRLCHGDQEIPLVFTRKTGALLVYLAYYSPQRHHREELMELLWQEQDPLAAQNNLRVALTTLRRLLKSVDPARPALLVTDRLYVQLSECRTDVAEFDALIRVARGAQTSAEQTPPLQSAVELYQGPLLPGFDGAWILAERQRLVDAYLWALDRLTLDAARARCHDQALDYAHRAVSADPLRESSHRSVMRLYAATGRPAAALQQYRELQRLLREELGTTPTAVTREFAAQLTPLPNEPIHQHAVVAVMPHSTRPATQYPSIEALLAEEPTRLPPHFTRIFGRGEETETIRKLLTEAIPAAANGQTCVDARLVTLAGPGGAGKTRLAREVAHNVEAAFACRLNWVSLGDCDDPDQIPDAVANVLGVKQPGGEDRLRQVVTVLNGQPTLLILDNFEHLLPAGGVVLQRLRDAVPTLVLLVTSRQRLDLPGEQIVPVQPLPVPMRTVSPNQLQECASVQLFIDRARAVRPEFCITTTNAAVVADLCRRLEGLPLAIELAAAWAHTLTPEAMLQRLDRAFDLLVNRQQVAPERHQTMHSAIEWSYRLLPADLQRFFITLAVFRGGWTIEAAAGVCREPDALERLRELQDRSLIYCVDTSDRNPRFGMLELVREFADQQLTRPERMECHRRHADWFLQKVEADRESLAGADQEQTLEDLERELGNIRAALCWYGALEGGEAEELRMAAALTRFWVVRAHMTEGRHYLRSALARQCRFPPTREFAGALRAAGTMAMMQFDNVEAEELFTECVALQRALGNERGVMDALLLLGGVTMNRGDRAGAEDLYRQCLEFGRANGHLEMEGCALMNLGELALDREDFAEARNCFTQSLEVYRRKQDLRYVAGSLHRLGSIAALEAKPQAGALLCREALAIMRRLGDKEGLVRVLLGTAEMMTAQSDYVAANQLYGEALPLVFDLHQSSYIAQVFEGVAYAALALEKLNLAGQLIGVAERLRQDACALMAPHEVKIHERRIAAGVANDTDGLFDSGRCIAATLTDERAREVARFTIALLTMGNTARWGDPAIRSET